MSLLDILSIPGLYDDSLEKLYKSNEDEMNKAYLKFRLSNIKSWLDYYRDRETNEKND